jgi:phosphate transport system protein
MGTGDLAMAEIVGGPTPQSLRNAFHRELDDVRLTIARLSATVTENVLRATDIVLRQDLDGAGRMILADDEVDGICAGLEERCFRLLALQAPVALDLREIVAALRISAEIERAADLAVNLCKAARRLHGVPLPPPIRGLIRRMGVEASRLFREATEAYVRSDAHRAATIRDMDDVLDELQREFVAAILDASGGIDLSTAVQLAMLARFYERLGDRAVTIAERVTYLVTGSLQRDR